MSATAKPRVEVRKVSDLTPDEHNANKGTLRGDYALGHSLERHGAGRSVLADKNGKLIAGNKTFRKYGEQGNENVIVVHTDGTQLVVVQRDDLDLDDPAARELAYADNRVSELDIAWDVEQMARDLAAGEIDMQAYWSQGELEKLLGNEGLALDMPDDGMHIEDDGSDTTTLSGSHIRMVQLFLTVTTQPLFVQFVERLAEHHNTANVTDTVFAVMEAAYNAA